MMDNIKSQMRKGLLEYCILLCLNRGEAYTGDLLRYLKEADLLVVEGTIYPLLSRLKKAGMLTYRWQESTEGPPRKYYAITLEGRQVLDSLEREWRQIAACVERLGQP